jgi:hypothetical protein
VVVIIGLGGHCGGVILCCEQEATAEATMRNQFVQPLRQRDSRVSRSSLSGARMKRHHTSDQSPCRLWLRLMVRRQQRRLCSLVWHSGWGRLQFDAEAATVRMQPPTRRAELWRRRDRGAKQGLLLWLLLLLLL